MRKIILTLALGALAMTAGAQNNDPQPQEETPTLQYNVVTNSFWSNWFVELGADWNNHYAAAMPTKSSGGIGLAFGKWFAPAIGLRTKVQGFWGPSYGDYSVKQFAMQEQVLLGLDNIFGGYNPKRRWALSLFLGAGVTRYMSPSEYALTTTAGLQVDYYVAPKWALYLESGLQFAEQGNRTISDDYNWWQRHNRNLYVELGVKYTIGRRGWKPAPDVEAIDMMHQSEIDALNSQLNDALEENRRLREGKVGSSDAEVIPDIPDVPEVPEVTNP